MDGAGRRIERDRLFADTVAYNTARLSAFAWHQPAKMPSFEKFRGRPSRRTAPTTPPDWRALQTQARLLNAVMGGKVSEP